jgi:hypothetical protein
MDREGWRYFAVFSDIHANSVAFEACLKRLDALCMQHACQPLVIINGDVLNTGPSPLETLHFAMQRGDVFIRGNHEEYLFDFVRHPQSARYKEALWRFVPWVTEQIGTDKVVEFYNACRFSFHTEDGCLSFFHASETSNARLPAFFGEQKKREIPLPLPQQFICDKLIFAGHSHYAALFPEPGTRRMWINCGSVGYPFFARPLEDPSLSYAVFVFGRYRKQTDRSFEVEVTFESVPYDVHDLLKKYVEKKSLSLCAPYSLAVLCQTVFNEDITFGFFQNARKKALSQAEMGTHLLACLRTDGYLDRLQSLSRDLGIELDLEGIARNITC